MVAAGGKPKYIKKNQPNEKPPQPEPLANVSCPSDRINPKDSACIGISFLHQMFTEGAEDFQTSLGKKLFTCEGRSF